MHDMKDYLPSLEELPHRYEINWLGPRIEPRLLAAVLRALDLEPELEEAPIGLSGVTHPTLLVGRRTAQRHVVVVQSGFHRSFDTGPPLIARIGEPPPPARDQRPLTDREEGVRRQLLFASYDMKASFEAQGWTCDILYFMNMSSPSDIGKSFSDELKRRFGDQLGGVDLRSTIYGGSSPIARIPTQALRQNAIATGACFLSLPDFSEDDLVAIASAPENEAVAAAKDAMERARVFQYFSPPADELMLSTLSEAQVEWSERELVIVPQASNHYKHPVASPSFLRDVNKDDPLQIAMALRGEKLIEYEGESSYVTDEGRKVTHKIKTTPQESWTKKIASVVDLVKTFTGFLG